MSSTASSRTFASALAGALLAVSGCTTHAPERLLHQDDFRHGLGQWRIEAEKPARVSAADGVLDIEAPAGITLWFASRLEGPVTIEFEATAVARGL